MSPKLPVMLHLLFLYSARPDRGGACDYDSAAHASCANKNSIRTATLPPCVPILRAGSRACRGRHFDGPAGRALSLNPFPLHFLSSSQNLVAAASNRPAQRPGPASDGPRQRQCARQGYKARRQRISQEGLRTRPVDRPGSEDAQALHRWANRAGKPSLAAAPARSATRRRCRRPLPDISRGPQPAQPRLPASAIMAPATL